MRLPFPPFSLSGPAKGPASLLFAGIVLLVAGVCTSPEREGAPEQSPHARALGDYVWMNYYRLRAGRTWMRIDETGSVLYVMTGAPGTKQIKAVKADTLSSAQTEQVFSHLRRIQFFQLEDAVPSGVVEADILKVVAHLDSQRHEVSARPPSDVPAGLMSLVDRLDSLAQSLSPVSGDRLLLRATSVSPDRAQKLRDSGIPRLSSAELSEFESVRTAVRYPGQFMLLDDKESAALRQKVGQAPYFLVTKDSQNVAVDIYSLPTRE